MFLTNSFLDVALELVTPPLDDVILPGITRQSALELAQAHAAGYASLPGLTQKLIVSERPVTMKEVKEAAKSNRLVEIFGTGTAAVITTINKIGYLGEDILVPTDDDGMGPVSRAMWTGITGRQTGKIPSDWNVVVTE